MTVHITGGIVSGLNRNPWVWLLTGAFTLLAVWGFVEVTDVAPGIKLVVLIPGLLSAGIVTWRGAALWLTERDDHAPNATWNPGATYNSILFASLAGTLLLASESGVLIFMVMLVIMGGVGVFWPMIRNKGGGEDLTDAEAARFSARRLARWTFALMAWVVLMGISGISADLLDDLPVWQDALISAGIILAVIAAGLYVTVIFPYRRVLKIWHQTDYERAQAYYVLLRFAHPVFGRSFFRQHGGMLFTAGQYAAAEASLRNALSRAKKPDDDSADESSDTTDAQQIDIYGDGKLASWLSLALLGQGATDDALRVIEQFLVHQPHNSAAQAALAELLAEIGDDTDYPRALESIQMALSSDAGTNSITHSNNSGIHFIMLSVVTVDRRVPRLALKAWILAEMGHIKQAEAALDASSAYFDAHPLPPLFEAHWHYFIGRAYRAMGRRQQAQTHFQTAASIDTGGDIHKRINRMMGDHLSQGDPPIDDGAVRNTGEKLRAESD
jgi:tetratricopeptide (TPR) repeat protein